ncbi:hypothetical protein NITGR_130002 [Nitrospina gracilis 3/211]|uniref:Uncharacterized protein n=1 Tax=Nitrospina gracilis (strain 3/211) TaxID=1266370 RepID=M1YGE7_NITG3|nr:hypothetical protein NITGR_130002 [Nitrospina gracilis 3/211]
MVFRLKIEKDVNGAGSCPEGGAPTLQTTGRWTGLEKAFVLTSNVGKFFELKPVALLENKIKY